MDNLLTRIVGKCVAAAYEILGDLSRIRHVDFAQLVDLVNEGVLTPNEDDSEQWLVAGPTLRRARKALRLSRDLHLDSASAALVLDLLDEIEALRSRLPRLGDFGFASVQTLA